MPDHSVHPASYRDPSGCVFQSGGLYYRQVNTSYAEHYEELLGSGLYEALTQRGWLVTHDEVKENLTGLPDWYKTLLPRQIPFISYPYEWSPAQLRDAALLTLRIQLLSIERGMILKDASPFNIQFVEGRPVFIDTLSFEHYDVSKPWVAYRQFCENFLFPLYIHHYRGGGCHKILQAWPEGIPAEATLKLLPFKSHFNLGLWLHVHLPGKVREDSPTHGTGSRKAPVFSRKKMGYVISHLETIAKGLRVGGAEASVWKDYYGRTISSPAYLQAKEKVFRSFIQGLSWKSALDLGANDGYFSGILSEGARLRENAPQEGAEDSARTGLAKPALDQEDALGQEIVLNRGTASDQRTALGQGTASDQKTASARGTAVDQETASAGGTAVGPKTIVAVDFDWQCIQGLYDTTKGQASSPILPLIVDLANPTPASGFHHTERASFTSRSRSDLVIALALIHHLALAKNIPLSKIGAYLADLTRAYLVAEFVPLTDEKSQVLIRNKSQWHSPYDENGFEAAFDPYFTIERKERIGDTERMLYLLKRRDAI